MKAIKKEEKRKETDLLRRVSQLLIPLPPPLLSPFSFMTEKTMASLPVDFRLFQFPSSTFASGQKKGRVSASGSRLVSFFIEPLFRLPWALPFRFLFYLPADLPAFSFSCPTLRPLPALQRIKKGSVEIQKNLLYRIAYISTLETARKWMSIQHKCFPRLLKISFFLFIYNLNN